MLSRKNNVGEVDPQNSYGRQYLDLLIQGARDMKAINPLFHREPNEVYRDLKKVRRAYDTSKKIKESEEMLDFKVALDLTKSLI